MQPVGTPLKKALVSTSPQEDNHIRMGQKKLQNKREGLTGDGNPALKRQRGRPVVDGDGNFAFRSRPSQRRKQHHMAPPPPSPPAIDDLAEFPPLPVALGEHRCHGCQKTFKHGGALTTHLKTCKHLNIFVCMDCDPHKAFSSKAALDGHRKVHRAMLVTQDEQQEEEEEEEDKMQEEADDVAMEEEDGHIEDFHVSIEPIRLFGSEQPGTGQAKAVVEFKQAFTSYLKKTMKKVAGRDENAPASVAKEHAFCQKVFIEVLDFNVSHHGGMRSVLGSLCTVEAVQKVYSSLIDVGDSPDVKKTRLTQLSRLLHFCEEEHYAADVGLLHKFIATKLAKLRPLIRKKKELKSLQKKVQQSSIFTQGTAGMEGDVIEVTSTSTFDERLKCCKEWYQNWRLALESIETINGSSFQNFKLMVLLLLSTLLPTQRKTTYQCLQHGLPKSPLAVSEDGEGQVKYIHNEDRFRLIFDRSLGAWRLVQSQNKTGFDFELEIPPEMTLLIKEHVAFVLKDFKALDGQGDPPVFPTGDGTCRVPSDASFSKWQKKFFKEVVGLPGQTFNLGRHALATFLVNLGIDKSGTLAQGYALAMNTSITKLFGEQRLKGSPSAASYADPTVANRILHRLAQQHLRNLVFRSELTFVALARSLIGKILRVEGGNALIQMFNHRDGVLVMAHPCTLRMVPSRGLKVLNGTLAPTWSQPHMQWHLSESALQQLRLLVVSHEQKVEAATSTLMDGWEGQLVLVDGRLAERRWLEKDTASHMQVLIYEEQATSVGCGHSRWAIGPHAHLKLVLRSSAVFLFDWTLDNIGGGIKVYK